jgi:hypothetical protein
MSDMIHFPGAVIVESVDQVRNNRNFKAWRFECQTKHAVDFGSVRVYDFKPAKSDELPKIVAYQVMFGADSNTYNIDEKLSSKITKFHIPLKGYWCFAMDVDKYTINLLAYREPAVKLLGSRTIAILIEKFIHRSEYQEFTTPEQETADV